MTTSSTRSLTEKQTSRIIEHIEAQIKLHDTASIEHNRLFGIARIISHLDSKWKFPNHERGSRVFPELQVPITSFYRVVEMLRKYGYNVETTDYTTFRYANVSKSNPI